MATVTNKFNRYLKPSIASGATTNIMTSNVPTGTDMTVMGLILTNTYNSPTNTPITIDVAMKNGATTCHLIKGGRIPEGESLIVIGWDQKLVMIADDNIAVTPYEESTTTTVSATFAATGKTITRASGSWITAGGVTTGSTVVISGTSSNNGTFTVDTVTDLVLTVNETVVDETISGTFAVTTPVSVDATLSVLEITTTA